MASREKAPAPARRQKDHEVITLRIGADDKERLLAHCHRLGKKSGKQVSYNSAVLGLIRQLPPP